MIWQPDRLAPVGRTALGMVQRLPACCMSSCCTSAAVLRLHTGSSVLLCTNWQQVLCKTLCFTDRTHEVGFAVLPSQLCLAEAEVDQACSSQAFIFFHDP
jgi:hypothetical protein